MKRLITGILVVAMVLGLSAVALAQNNTYKMLGTWEVTYPEYGTFIVKVNANGVGESSQDGEALDDFAFVVRGNKMAGAELEADGEIAFEVGELTFVDEDTIALLDGDNSVTFHRVAPAEAEQLELDNAFIGSWVADLPEAKGARMDYLPDGTMVYHTDEYDGAFGYLVFGDMMAILTDEGELETFRFEVVDPDNLVVTEIATGEVAQFVRVVAE